MRYKLALLCLPLLLACKARPPEQGSALRSIEATKEALILRIESALASFDGGESEVISLPESGGSFALTATPPGETGDEIRAIAAELERRLQGGAPGPREMIQRMIFDLAALADLAGGELSPEEAARIREIIRRANLVLASSSAVQTPPAPLPPPTAPAAAPTIATPAVQPMPSAPPPTVHTPAPSEPACPPGGARIVVNVPGGRSRDPICIDGNRTSKTGTRRTFCTPRLESDATYLYSVGFCNSSATDVGVRRGRTTRFDAPGYFQSENCDAIEARITITIPEARATDVVCVDGLPLADVQRTRKQVVTPELCTGATYAYTVGFCNEAGVRVTISGGQQATVELR